MISKSNFPPLLELGVRPALRPPTVCRKRPRSTVALQHDPSITSVAVPAKVKEGKLSPRMPTAPGCRPSKGDNFPLLRGAPGAMAAPPLRGVPRGLLLTDFFAPTARPPGACRSLHVSSAGEPPKAAGRQRRGRSPRGPGPQAPPLGVKTPPLGAF